MIHKYYYLERLYLMKILIHKKTDRISDDDDFNNGKI